MRRITLPVRAFIAGALLFLGVLLLARSFTHLGFTAIVGWGLAVALLCGLLLSFTQPLASHRALRKGFLLQCILPASLLAAILLSAWPATAPFALYAMLAGIVLYAGVVRPYIRKVNDLARKDGGRDTRE